MPTAGTDDRSHHSDAAELSEAIKAQARQIGFTLVGITPAVTPPGFSYFRQWVDRGFAGEMTYLPSRLSARKHPRSILESVRSLVVVALTYAPAEPAESNDLATGRVSCYARGTRDYHDVLREKLKQLGDFLHKQRPGVRTRAVVDTAPLLERDFARLAGLGWFGKNTMLISKQVGSFLFLGALLVDIDLSYDLPHETAHCGRCTRCLDACPTNALIEPYTLDARRCISYLTIELRDAPIPKLLRRDVGMWSFGCDVCQEVCPWNGKPRRTTASEGNSSIHHRSYSAADWLDLDADDFRSRFQSTPFERPGRAGLLRNAAIVLGNTGRRDFVPVLVKGLNDAEPLVRGASAWALGQLGGEPARSALQSRRQIEEDAGVVDEITDSLRWIETQESECQE